MVSSITGLISKVQYLALRFQIVLFLGWKIANKWHWLKNKNLKWRKSPIFNFLRERVTIGLSIGYTFNDAVQNCGHLSLNLSVWKNWPLLLHYRIAKQNNTGSEASWINPASGLYVHCYHHPLINPKGPINLIWIHG